MGRYLLHVRIFLGRVNKVCTFLCINELFPSSSLLSSSAEKWEKVYLATELLEERGVKEQDEMRCIKKSLLSWKKKNKDAFPSFLWLRTQAEEREEGVNPSQASMHCTRQHHQPKILPPQTEGGGGHRGLRMEPTCSSLSPQPPTVMETQLEYIVYSTYCIHIFAHLAPICMLIRSCIGAQSEELFKSALLVGSGVLVSLSCFFVFFWQTGSKGALNFPNFSQRMRETPNAFTFLVFSLSLSSHPPPVQNLSLSLSFSRPFGAMANLAKFGKWEGGGGGVWFWLLFADWKMLSPEEEGEGINLISRVGRQRCQVGFSDAIRIWIDLLLAGVHLTNLATWQPCRSKRYFWKTFFLSKLVCRLTVVLSSPFFLCRRLCRKRLEEREGEKSQKGSWWSQRSMREKRRREGVVEKAGTGLPDLERPGRKHIQT